MLALGAAATFAIAATASRTFADSVSPSTAAVTAANVGRVISRDLWPEPAVPGHPILTVIDNLLAGAYGPQPAWKLPMLINSLAQKPADAIITAYCERDHDGGGSYTRWGTHLRRGICAADPRYYGPGSVVWIGEPINESLIVEDTGGAIKGENRFDVCVTGHHALCSQIGRRHTQYVVLYRVPPRSRWGGKPDGWEPPVVDIQIADGSVSNAAE